ncbi:MAG: hypothetical protein R3C61_28480 [Bacteroidia bacterium]
MNLGDYRFGFQGQEADNEVYGTGNAVSYKYRVEDPRLGRFFSGDPLSAEYPWNSPYAFSENRVVDAVELEGLERITIHEYSPPQGGNPGKATITISSFDYIIRSGQGSIATPINPTAYENLYNLGDREVKLAKLPTQFAPPIVATANDINTNNYYNTKIDYQYYLVDDPGMTLHRAQLEQKADNLSGHIFRLPIPNYSTTDNLAINRFGNPTQPLAGGVTDSELNSDETFLNPLLFGSSAISLPPGTLTTEEIMAHERGHGSAYKLNHQEYPQAAPITNPGILSNMPGQVRPVFENSTLEIISDPKNRSTIKMIK